MRWCRFSGALREAKAKLVSDSGMTLASAKTRVSRLEPQTGQLRATRAPPWNVVGPRDAVSGRAAMGSRSRRAGARGAAGHGRMQADGPGSVKVALATLSA